MIIIKIKQKIRRLFGLETRQAFVYHRLFFNCIRKKPTFFIIGVQKAGTTSLYNYLIQHPQIKEALIKETHFFNMNYNKGMFYYRALFPISFSKQSITGEATPDYFDHPKVPERLYKHFPDAKLIVIFRNPLDRAFSHFNFVQSYNDEEKKLTFEEALNLEEERLKFAFDRLDADIYNSAREISNYGYVYKSLYSKHLSRWLKFFPLSNFLFIDFDELKKSPNDVLKKIFKFLGVKDDFSINDTKVRNKTTYRSMLNDETKKELEKKFEKYNTELKHLTKIDFKW